MKTHSTLVSPNHSNVNIARRVAALRFDKMEAFFAACAAELSEAADRDLAKGRKQLSAKLKDLSHEMEGEIVGRLHDIFEMCKPFMQQELKGEDK